jgi:DnaD/phage-associated family protein
MPDTCFKLWIYCLLKASPFPTDELRPGEFFLSYKEIQENLGQYRRCMSKSTVSRALRYLEEQGYLSLEVTRFRGIKARVLNWHKYQAGTESVPGECSPGTESVLEEKPENMRDSEMPGTESVPGECSPGTESVLEEKPENMRDSEMPGTESVPVNPLPGTESVPDRVLSEYPTGTPGVPRRAPQPNSCAVSEPPKNNKNNNKNNIDPAAAAAGVIQSFEQEFGRPLSPIEIEQIVNWQMEFPEDLIREALVRAVLKDKRTLAYVGGILRGWKRAGISTVKQAIQQDELRRQKHTGSGDVNKQKDKRKELIRSLYCS